MSERDDDRLDDPILEAWPEHRAAPSFPDRVMAALPAPGRPPRRAGRWPALGAFGAGVAVALLATWWLRPGGGEAEEIANREPPAARGAGALQPAARTEARLGPHLRAVVEADAVLGWERAGPVTDVRHDRGRAFYRAGGPVAVRTPAAALEVDGAAFAVDASPARTDVVVYAGQVAVHRGGERVVVRAGETRRITRGGVGPRRPAPWLATEQPPPAPRATTAAITDPSPAPCPDEPSAFEPGAATLAAWARACRLTFDVAPLGYDAGMLEHFLDEIGAEPGERDRIAAAVGAIDAAADQAIERLFVDATGDQALAETSSVQWMFDEVLRSALVDEPAQVRRRIARERAALRAPPADLHRVSPYEELVRILMRSGDQLQRALDEELGPRRSLALRRRRGGWPGLRWDVAGCPPE